MERFGKPSVFSFTRSDSIFLKDGFNLSLPKALHGLRTAYLGIHYLKAKNEIIPLIKFDENRNYFICDQMCHC